MLSIGVTGKSAGSPVPEGIIFALHCELRAKTLLSVICMTGDANAVKSKQEVLTLHVYLCQIFVHLIVYLNSFPIMFFMRKFMVKSALV